MNTREYEGGGHFLKQALQGDKNQSDPSAALPFASQHTRTHTSIQSVNI